MLNCLQILLVLFTLYRNRVYMLFEFFEQAFLLHVFGSTIDLGVINFIVFVH